jgi:hypothetical protein
MCFELGFGELALIFIVVVVVFAATNLPTVGESLGRLRRGQPPAPRLLLQRRRPWSRSDRVATVLSAVLAAATVVLLVRGQR